MKISLPYIILFVNGEEKREDIDFTVDYTNHTINFPSLNNNSETILNAGDKLVVVYTPNLEDTGIALGYRAKRTNKDKRH